LPAADSPRDIDYVRTAESQTTYGVIGVSADLSWRNVQSPRYYSNDTISPRQSGRLSDFVWPALGRQTKVPRKARRYHVDAEEVNTASAAPQPQGHAWRAEASVGEYGLKCPWKCLESPTAYRKRLAWLVTLFIKRRGKGKPVIPHFPGQEPYNQSRVNPQWVRQMSARKSGGLVTAGSHHVGRNAGVDEATARQALGLRIAQLPIPTKFGSRQEDSGRRRIETFPKTAQRNSARRDGSRGADFPACASVEHTGKPIASSVSAQQRKSSRA